MSAPDRRSMIAKLHMARKDLALTEDSYRDVLERVAGKRSAAELRDAQLHAVLAEFKRLGWDAKPAARRAGQPHQRMIYAIWQDIAPLIEDGSREALRKFCRHQVGVEVPDFMDSAKANRVIEALKAWRARLKRRAAGRAA